MEGTSGVMDWLSLVPLGRRLGHQGDSGGIARHSTFTGEPLTQLPRALATVKVALASEQTRERERVVPDSRPGGSDSYGGAPGGHPRP